MAPTDGVTLANFPANARRLGTWPSDVIGESAGATWLTAARDAFTSPNDIDGSSARGLPKVCIAQRFSSLLSRFTEAAYQDCAMGVPIAYEGAQILVGPALLPPKAGCLRCADTRTFAQLDDRALQQTLRQARQDQSKCAPLGFLLHHALMVLALAAQVAADAIADPSELPVQVTYDTTIGEIRRWTVIPDPECTVCGVPQYGPPLLRLPDERKRGA